MEIPRTTVEAAGAIVMVGGAVFLTPRVHRI